jgi:hypothetical protein
LMVASWSISEEKYPQKNQGTAGLGPATFSFNCHLQARLTSALLLPLSPVLKWHGQYQGLGTIPAVAGCPSPLGYDPQVPPYASKTLPSSSGITSMSHHARLPYDFLIYNYIQQQRCSRLERF